jgi:hypothetical protein
VSTNHRSASQPPDKTVLISYIYKMSWHSRFRQLCALSKCIFSYKMLRNCTSVVQYNEGLHRRASCCGQYSDLPLRATEFTIASLKLYICAMEMCRDRRRAPVLKSETSGLTSNLTMSRYVAPLLCGETRLRPILHNFDLVAYMSGCLPRAIANFTCLGSCITCV